MEDSVLQGKVGATQSPPPSSGVGGPGVGGDGSHVMIWSYHVGRYNLDYDQAVALAYRILHEAMALKGGGRT